MSKHAVFKYGYWQRPYSTALTHVKIEVFHGNDGFIVRAWHTAVFPVEIVGNTYRPGAWSEYAPLFERVIDVIMIQLGFVPLPKDHPRCPLHGDPLQVNGCRRCVLKEAHLAKQALEEGRASLPEEGP